jgi:hypothetical protein
MIGRSPPPQSDIRDDVRVGRDLLARIVAGPGVCAAVRSWRY